MRWFGFFLLMGLLTSCGGGADTAYEAITAKEDSIAKVTETLKPGQVIPEGTTEELIGMLEQFVKDYPDDEHAAECLDKLHMAYSGLRDYKKAAEYADRVIKDFPGYINRAMVLESQAGNYDFFILPRDTAKVRYYYNLLLKEEIPSDKRKDILKRLDHLDLTIDQYILAQ